MSNKRVAFVTGGLGAAICRRLHDADMVVAMSHSERNDHVATWLMHECDAGRRFVAYEADVASFDSCEIMDCDRSACDTSRLIHVNRCVTAEPKVDDAGCAM